MARSCATSSSPQKAHLYQRCKLAGAPLGNLGSQAFVENRHSHLQNQRGSSGGENSKRAPNERVIDDDERQVTLPKHDRENTQTHPSATSKQAVALSLKRYRCEAAAVWRRQKARSRLQPMDSISPGKAPRRTQEEARDTKQTGSIASSSSFPPRPPESGSYRLRAPHLNLAHAVYGPPPT